MPHAFGIRFHCLRENVVVLVAAELELPTLLTSGRRRGKRFFAQQAQLFAFHFAAGWIEPDLVPIVAGDFDCAFRDHGLFIRVQRLQVHGDFVSGPVDVSLRSRVDVVTLPGNPNCIAADDLAPR